MYIAIVQKLLIAILFILNISYVLGQEAKIDTLLFNADKLLYDNTNEAILLTEEALQLNINDTQRFNALYMLGECHYMLGDFDKSLSFYRKSQKIAEKLKNEFLLSKSFLGIGTAHDDNGDPEKGLDLYFKALAIREKLGNKTDISPVLNNIAVTYYKQNKLDKAIEYMKKCVLIDKELNDSTGLGYSYSNLGSFLYFDNQNDSAIYYHELALHIREKLGEKMQVSRSLNNIANTYVEMGEIDLAVRYYRQAIDIKRELDNPYELANGMLNLGITLSNHNKAKEALPVLLESKEILTNFDNNDQLQDNIYALAKTYATLNNMDSAYSFLLRSHELNKEIYNETRSQQIEEMVAKFETEKTEKENEELKTKEALSKLENEELKLQKAESKNKIYLLIGSLVILLSIAALILMRLRINRRNTNILQGLNNQLEEKNSDITDSIQYAKRIQQALLPSKQDLSNIFNEAFVLFMPRDIVSGDFYWVHEQGDKVFFAVADCTGHGVPGAFVSVLCNNLLGHAVSEHGLSVPGEILTDVNKGITNRLRKENASYTMMDGMDISLCMLNKTTNELQFSGAMNPVLIYSGKDMIEYKGTKEAIGGLDHGKEFETITHQLNKGDMIYLFSDGYQDQFGGEKGKKFKYKNLKEQLHILNPKALTQQHDVLKKMHIDWRADLEQLDDVCLMGIRV